MTLQSTAEIKFKFDKTSTNTNTNTNTNVHLLTSFCFAIAAIVVIVTTIFAHTLANTVHNLAVGSSRAKYLKVQFHSEIVNMLEIGG